MKIFDLHNDALTENGAVDSSDTIYAIWTTQLSRKKVYELISENKSKMLAIEDCGIFFDNFDSLLSCCKFMYIGLTWNNSNAFGGGAYSYESLTALGKKAILSMNDRNMVLDTAHLNKPSFYDAIETADKVICSHTCFYNVNHHPRNLTKEQIRAIINKRGIVGLCLVGDFLGGNDIETVIRHIDWFLDNFGDKNLSVGTDFYGTDKLPEGLKSYKDFDRLILEMIRRGYSDSTINKILYKNAAAYFSDRDRRLL